jgi:hypothetical protein
MVVGVVLAFAIAIAARRLMELPLTAGASVSEFTTTAVKSCRLSSS